MGKIIGYIVLDLQILVGFISFIISLNLIGRNNIPNYMKGFYWYPTVGLIVGIPNFINCHFIDDFNFAVQLNNYSLLFHFYFLSNFIIKITPHKDDFKYLNLFSYFILVILILILFSNNLNKHVYQAFSISSLGLTILCLIYYFQLFKNIPTVNLKYEPSFWVITGIFFCMSVIVPTTSMIDYLRNKISHDVLLMIYHIGGFSYAVMHLFFIKAIICAVRPHKA